MAHEIGTVSSGTTSMACLWCDRQSVVAGAGKEVALAACRTGGTLFQVAQHPIRFMMSVVTVVAVVTVFTLPSL